MEINQKINPVLCPVCKSSDNGFFAFGWDSEYQTLPGKFAYQRCKNCSTVFMDKPPVGRLKEIYPPTYYSFSNDFNRSLLQKIKDFLEVRMFRKILKSIPGERLSVLDVGGGNGWLLKTVKKADHRVSETHIVDIDETAQAIAIENGHVFHCQRIEDFNTTRKFDLILLLNLLEHVSDPAALMKKLAGMISSNGLIFIKTPNTDTLDCRLFWNKNWGGLHCPRHWVLFNRASLFSLASRCGLEVSSFSYTQGAPQWTASILGFLSDRGIISITAERPMHRHPLFNFITVMTAAFDFLRSPFSKTAQMFCVLRLPLSNKKN